MRLVVVAEQLRRQVPGGIGTYVRGLLGGLAALGSGDGGPDVTLLTSRAPGGGDPVASLGPPVMASRLPSRFLPLAWLAGLAPAPGGFDVVHATSFAAPPTGSTPLTMAVHDLIWRQVPETFPWWGRRWHEAALGRALRRAAVLMVDSPAVADAVVAAGASEDQVRVVDPMRGSDHLPPPDQSGAERVLARLGVHGPYLLSVSTIEPRKNLTRLLQAYWVARGQLPEPWPLVVVGPRGWGPALETVPGVVLAGGVDDAVLAALYARSRCVAYVPLLEGFGLPAVEAMACGVPVVASPVPSTAGAALQVDPYDVDEMARALVRAACDDGVRRRLVEAGLRRARELTWQNVARRHVEVWEGLR